MRTINQKYGLVALRFIDELEEEVYRAVQKFSEKNNKNLEEEKIRTAIEKLKDNYLTKVRKLPSMITHNGLLTTLTFLYAKSEGKTECFVSKEGKINCKAEGILLRQLVKFLKADNMDAINNSSDIKKEDVSSFLKELADKDFKNLKLYTRKALNFSQWLKRLAEGTFGEEGD